MTSRESDRQPTAGTHDDRPTLDERLRAEFIAGAEEDSRRRLVRGLTMDELERVLQHYPGIGLHEPRQSGEEEAR